MRLKTANNKGFTLLELIIVMAIIGILAATVIFSPGIIDNPKKANDTSNLDMAVKIQQQIYSYTINGATLPDTILSTRLTTLESEDIVTLKNNGILSTEANVPENTFYLILSGEGTPNVGFKLTSTQYKSTSKCYDGSFALQTTCVDSYFLVPFSGKLGGGR